MVELFEYLYELQMSQFVVHSGTADVLWMKLIDSTLINDKIDAVGELL